MTGRADLAIVKYLESNGYHPRSSKHGDALCEVLVNDLNESCLSFQRAAGNDEIVFQTNYTIDPESPDRWNTDLVIGPPKDRPSSTHRRIGPIAQGDPLDIWIAVDAKTIMTEHGKARRNRQRDLNSFQDILHRKNPKTIVGGLLVVNMAGRFKTPLARASGGLNLHRNIERLVEEIVSMIGGLARADAEGTKPGNEALGIIVISHTNLPSEPTRLITAPPAPQPGRPLSYAAFLQELCEAFTTRFATA